MKNFKNKFIITAKSIGFIAVALLAGATVSYAGSLTPSATPSATFYTLGDIYNKLTTGATTTEANHSLSTSTSPASSFYTFTKIYNAVPPPLSLSDSTTTVPVGINTATTTLDTIDTDLTATNIKSGVTIFGVAGSYTGSAPSLTWSADAHSGTDASIFTDQTSCKAWGATWDGSACSGLSDQPVGYQCWDGNQGCSEGPNTGVIAGHGAVEYCQYLDNSGNLSATVQNIWHLPTYTELVDASPSGDHVTSGFQSVNFWSATPYPFYSPLARFVNMYDGGTGNDLKHNPYYLVRCAR